MAWHTRLPFPPFCPSQLSTPGKRIYHAGAVRSSMLFLCSSWSHTLFNLHSSDCNGGHCNTNPEPSYDGRGTVTQTQTYPTIGGGSRKTPSGCSYAHEQLHVSLNTMYETKRNTTRSSNEDNNHSMTLPVPKPASVVIRRNLPLLFPPCGWLPPNQTTSPPSFPCRCRKNSMRQIPWPR